MKKALKALWHGIKAVFTALVDWVATLFGMNDNSKYSRRLRRIVSTAFTVTITAFAVVLLIKLASSLYEDFACNSDDDGYLSEQLSDDIAYYEHYYDNNGYLLNAKGKKVLEEPSPSTATRWPATATASGADTSTFATAAWSSNPSTVTPGSFPTDAPPWRAVAA